MIFIWESFFMGKLYWKPGNMLYPLPVVMVSVRDKDIDNIITVAWAGTINSDPSMLSISVRKERFSYEMLKIVESLS
jgi:flavin reductase (DIM6/NTAB) family NADH-FMN oxidoreductase RutF